MGFLAELSSRRFIYASPSDDCEKVRGEGESINIVILGGGHNFFITSQFASFSCSFTPLVSLLGFE